MYKRKIWLRLFIIVFISGLLAVNFGMGGKGCIPWGREDHQADDVGSSSPLPWSVKTWGGDDLDAGDFDPDGGCRYRPALAVDSQDNIYVSGFTRSYGANPNVTTDNVLLKYNSAGSLQWTKTWGSSTADDGFYGGIALDTSDNIYVVGTTTKTNSTNIDAFLLRYLSNGTLDWAYTWGEDGADHEEGASAVVVDSSDNVYVCGTTDITVGKWAL